MTYRIEPFFFVTQRIKLFFKWLKELNLFLNDSNWTSWNDSKKWTFFNFDSQDWTLFLWIWPKNWTFCFLSMTQWIEPLNYQKYDAKNSTFFLNMTQRIELFLLSVTQRFGPFFKYDGKIWTLFRNMTQRFFLYESKNGNFLNMTHGIELYFSLFFWTWLKERNPF